MQPGIHVHSSSLVVSLKTKDIDALARGIPGWDMSFTQVSPGRFAGSFELLPLPGVTLCHIEANREVLACGSHRSGTTGFGFPHQPLPPSIVSGQQMKPGQIIGLGPAQTLDQKTGSHYQAVFVEMDCEVFHQAMRTLLQRDEYAQPGASTLMMPRQADADRVSGHLYRILDRMKNGDAACSSTPVLRKMLHQLMVYQAAMLGDPHQMIISSGRWKNRRSLVMEAEQLMAQHDDGSITMVDLCTELAVSERSLHYAFEEIRGQTPMTWYRIRRLNAVRRTLKQADSRRISISEVAQASGFHHPGAFAAAYQKLFGELPSDTLAEKYTGSFMQCMNEPVKLT